MINLDRIVPVVKIDLLSLIGTVLGLIGTSYGVLASSDTVGTFAVAGSGAAGNFLCNQPVKTLDFPAAVTSATVYFVADYDYSGMSIAGTAATPTGTVNADGVTLYKAVLGSGTITITAVTPVAA